MPCRWPPFSNGLCSLTLLTVILLVNANVHIVPHFTSLPPPVSYYIDSHSGDSGNQNPLDLICRAWPPNAKVYLVASQVPLSSDHRTVLSSSDRGIVDSLRPLPQGLGNQRFGLVPASLIPVTSSIANERQTTSSLRESINHDSLLDATRARPAAGPNDEVGVRLSVASMSEVRALELLRLHCLAATTFGHILSRPFHVIPASLGEFPQQTSSTSPHSMSPKITTAKFFVNNIAVVECQLPLNAFPTPVVHFELNGTQINEAALQNDKYRIVWRPDGQRVSLLIHKVQFHDGGTYRCAVTNPLTGEKRYAPEATQLQLINPERVVETRIAVPLAPSSAGDRSESGGSTKSQQILVDEGQNVTLFCVFHGVPPPTVATYPFDQNFTSNPRFYRDAKFGLLQITDVQLRDSGVYLCTDQRMTYAAQLHVKPQLRLITQPQDVILNTLGGRAEFRCNTSDPLVTPYWLFNGQPKSAVASGGENILTIANVTVQDLGVYQCVAKRASTKRLGDEWASASAVLALASDKIIKTPEDLAVYTPQRPVVPLESTTEVTTSELTPQAQALYDNLAVYLVWQPLGPEVSGMEQSKSVEYRLEYSVQVNPAEEQQNGPNSTETPAALVGLIGHEAVRWSEPSSLKQQTSVTYAYVTENIVKPSKRYRFRVIAVDPSTGVSLVPPSDWSNTVSMEHISPVDPPQIKVVRPMSNGRVQLMWSFDGQGQNKKASEKSPTTELARGAAPASNPQQRLQSPTASLFSLDADPTVFVPDFFLVLARPLVKPKSSGNSGDSFKYGAYWATQVNGSDVREGILTGLNRTSSYQIIVYGVRGTGDKRQITRFSKAAYVNLATAEHSGTYSLLKALVSNRLMYLILGGIAALMFFVVFIFILLCVCRQQRDRRVASQRKKQNGFVQNYKDASQYIPVSTNDGTRPEQRHSSANTLSNHGAGGMLMTNLQCSAFSDHSVSNQAQVPTMLQQQQQAELKHQMYLQQQHQQQQQQQMDQYAAMSKEAAAMMQHQSVVGSQMHLPQQQHMYHPAHHQSHHSLLLPPGGTPVLQGQPGVTPMYQSGTLPGGPRYLRQQSFPAHFGGSQQPLSRTGTPANPTDMTDFYQQQQQQQHPHTQQMVYAHHQPQLPPVPHPQTSELPPPYGMSSGAIQRQMVYYPGSITPSGASLKREPPTGGSLQDGSAYGTLLQRGQLTGSMIHDPASATAGAMSPANYPNSAYYHGSQQALHMMPNMCHNGIGTPQSGHATLYSPAQQQAAFYAQQQQAQYPGYYGQPLQQPPEALAHGPHGFGPTDGESIYSYFSQQDMMQPNSHQPLNPLPEENQMNGTGGPGYVDSGMQTADAGTQGAEGSPAGGGSHRHHRRRRRKQPRHPSDLQNGTNGNTTNDSAEAAGEVSQFVEQVGTTQPDDRRQMFEQEQLPGQKHQYSMSNAGTYSDADPMSAQPSFTSQSYHQAMNASDSNRTNCMRYDSPQREQLMSGHQMPPPNQPPPPPPAVALGLGSPSVVNGHYHQNPPSYQINSQTQSPGAGDSVSRRMYSGAPGAAGLLVGPPPRIRDYSEYGILRGVGLPPTPSGGQPQPPQHNVLMGNSAVTNASAHVNGTMMYEGRYREGQA
ncbi:Cell adhesion molecule [Clonorchis sinensis]|uniref:Cell adhesion molecule n=1 Tax=Clonorchis sinensis TaxID=79923 RepID=A0A8T1LWF6_CLOSI|nr:Cell adhesion molecule [Clonorchis sinensis]